MAFRQRSSNALVTGKAMFFTIILIKYLCQLWNTTDSFLQKVYLPPISFFGIENSGSSFPGLGANTLCNRIRIDKLKGGHNFYPNILIGLCVGLNIKE